MKYIPFVSTDEKLFVGHIADLIRVAGARHCARFSSFLNLREQMLAHQAVDRNNGLYSMFYGGAPGNERVVLGVSPQEISECDFPITYLDFTASAPVSHRDVLGAVLSLGVDRDKTGDIYVCENHIRIFVLKVMADYINSNLTDIGHASVQKSSHKDIQFQTCYENKRVTIASNRMDSVVAAVINHSRSDAARLIEAGLVSVNHLVINKFSFELDEGDVLAVRGFGKFKIENIAGVSRKGRLILEYKKYI